MVTIQVSSPANVLFFEECKFYNKLIQTVLVVVLALQRVILMFHLLNPALLKVLQKRGSFSEFKDIYISQL